MKEGERIREKLINLYLQLKEMALCYNFNSMHLFDEIMRECKQK